MKLEELASGLDLEKAKAETNAHKKKIFALETKKNDLQTLQEETSSLSEKIAGLKAEIANQEKKSLLKLAFELRPDIFYPNEGCYFFLNF